jgi:methionine-rich copper-binding protein CopC
VTRAALAALLLVLLVPATAGAHAVLVKSSPARRAVVAAPPRIELVFNERLEPAYSTVSVWTADNRRVDDGKVVVGPEDPRRLAVGLPPMPGGTYTVKFRVLSVDGHIVEGTFPFEVRPRP